MKEKAYLVFLLFLAACLSQAPPLRGEVVLTVSGSIGKTNAGDTYQFDMETLKALPSTTLVIPDPHLEATITYGGVLLRDLLDAVKAQNAKEIKIVAKDGYSTVIRAEDLALGILIAYTADGAEIPEDLGGPVKIVFSEDAQKVYGPENWVWWIKAVEVS